MHPLLGTCPATQICVLTGNRTGDPLVHRLALDPLNHTSQDHLFFVLIFLKYILLIMLLQLSHFPPSLLSALHTPSHPHFPPLVHVHGPYIEVLWLLHSCTILTLPLSISTYYLCYLFSVPFPPLSPSHSPADNPPCDLPFCGSVPVLVVGLVYFCFCFRWGC